MHNAWLHWCWKINQQNNKLELWLADKVSFLTTLTTDQLNISLENEAVPFTTEDAELYTAFRDILLNTSLDQQSQFTVAINAAAACNYLKPLAPKSWLFDVQNKNAEIEFFGGDFIQVETHLVDRKSVDEGAEASLTATYMILEPEASASTAILLSPQHYIDQHRTYHCGQIIKAHNDRFRILHTKG